MINVGIMGATGYTGEELIDILLKHPEVRLTSISRKTDSPQAIAEIFPKFSGRTDLICGELDIEETVAKCDLVFLALPHTASMAFVPKLLKSRKRVIDLSADYRIKDSRTYEQFYRVKHKDKANLAKAIYGLPELYRSKIIGAQLIANPGCYPTVSLLALAPLVAFDLIEPESIIIDAKSGVTGAGRKTTQDFFFSEVNEDFKAYKVNTHQHIPEIKQELSRLSGKKPVITFVPHLLPVNRGILATIYVRKFQHPTPKTQHPTRKTQDLIDLYKRFYKKEPFIRIKVKGSFPALKDVQGTNFCDIAIQDEGDKIIIIAAIDNLLKGASGQAVQNMNIMYKFPERTGL